MGVGTRAEKALLEADFTTVGDLLNVLNDQGDDGLLAFTALARRR